MPLLLLTSPSPCPCCSSPPRHHAPAAPHLPVIIIPPLLLTSLSPSPAAPHLPVTITPRCSSSPPPPPFGPQSSADTVQDLSADFCQRLLASTLRQPPDLVNLQEFLSATPSARLPIEPLEYAQLPTDLRQMFIPSIGVLARAFTNSIFPLPYGTISGSASEHMTVRW